MGDIIENRRLVAASLLLTALALAAAAVAKQVPLFLAASFVIGLGSVAAQVLVPFASYLASESSRGRVVGNVMSGLLLGIMLSRPLSILIADLLGWHAVFVLSGAAVLVLAIVLSKVLPARRPSSYASYAALLGSMWRLLRTTPLLRRRAAYHACVFATFSLFWTTVPFLLAKPDVSFFPESHRVVRACGHRGRGCRACGRTAGRPRLDQARHRNRARYGCPVGVAAAGRPDRFHRSASRFSSLQPYCWMREYPRILCLDNARFSR